MKQLGAIAALFLLIAVYNTGCQHKSTVQPSNTNNNNNNNPNNPSNPADTALCFERDILPIFTSSCAKSGCHDAASHQEGYVFTSWQTITSKDFVAGNPEETKLYKKIMEDKPSDIMPPPPDAPLTPAQKELIRRWIADGAKNTTNCGTLCDSNKFTYTADIKPIIDKYCKGCHSGVSAQKGIVLDTYAGLYAATTNGKLLDAINHRAGAVAMPYNTAKLSSCEIRQIEKWAADGAQNN